MICIFFYASETEGLSTRKFCLEQAIGDEYGTTEKYTYVYIYIYVFVRVVYIRSCFFLPTGFAKHQTVHGIGQVHEETVE